MAVGFVPVVLSDDVMPHALRSILMAPAAMLLAAIGAGEMLSRLGGFRAAVEVARRTRSLPVDVEKMVVFREGDEMSAAPVMFLTGSYTAAGRAEKHIVYATSGDCAQANVFCLEGVR
jgi:hypothetical protein